MNEKAKTAKKEVIGIIGTGRGVGVTHFALMTAGYLRGVLQKHCAVLEWNNHCDFQRIGKMYEKGRIQGSCYRILESDYYGKAGVPDLLLCKRSDYQAVIVDYGTVKEGNLEEFLRCDRQFVLGSLSEWQMEAFLAFEGKERKTEKSWETLTVFGSEEARKNMEKKLLFPVRRIPVSVDVFIVTSEMLSFYQQFFL